MLLIHHATAADAESIAAIHLASWRTVYVRELPPAFLATLDLPDRTRAWRERMRANRGAILMAVENGAIVGFCACGPSRDADADPSAVWEIEALHVEPARRGGGIGLRLFHEARQLGARAGASALTLWVVRTNDHAQRFYRREGMEPDGAAQRHVLADGVALEEIRFRRPTE
jgi:GNAT superfamily N-acetyltransferase